MLGAVASALQDVGADDPGTQDAHANSKRLYLHSEPLGHADDGKFACRIGREALMQIEHPSHRRGVDDVPALTMCSHMRQESSHPIDDADQIHVEKPAPVVERDMVDASQSTNPGVVA